MGDFMLAASKVAISALEKVIKADLIVEGLENIPTNPCLFVVNHFTRMETFILPYVLLKHKGMKVHSLASTSLFKGSFGKYLLSVGTVPKRAPGRNGMIIHDLLTGDSNWVIYPEGVMVKNKSVFEKGKFRIMTPSRHGPPHTGASVLALKAELIRQDCIRLAGEGKLDQVKDLQEKYEFNAESDVSQKGVVIVPVNITYYPLRPGENFISDVAGLLFKDLPSRVDEELQTEGKILLTDSDINIYFGKPLELQPEVERAASFSSKYLPFVSTRVRENAIIRLKKKKISHESMKRIYTRTAIHIDHLFCMALRKSVSDRIHRKDFARALYISALEAGVIEHRRTHPTLESDLIKCIVDEDYSPLESVCKLAESIGALKRDGEYYHINKKNVTGHEHPFHDIRIKNAAIVIANELEPLKQVVDMISRNINMSPSVLKERLAKTLHERNVKEFDNDYDEYFDPVLSKDRSNGQPIFLHSKGNRAGIVLVHGYLAATQEMRPMAEYLFKLGFSVYVPAIKGMGTAPRQLKDVTCEDWIYSFDKAYVVIRNSCRDVYAGGFSAGGLLALIAAARKKDAIKALFTINAPLLLQDMKSRLVPGIVTWNEFIEKIHLGEFKKLEYIENSSESPDINYERNYTKGVLELNHLTNVCRASLSEVTSPLLVIQGGEDPVVKPESAAVICNKVSSVQKELEVMPFNNHIIVRRERREEVFERTKKFLMEIRDKRDLQ